MKRRNNLRLFPVALWMLALVAGCTNETGLPPHDGEITLPADGRTTVQLRLAAPGEKVHTRAEVGHSASEDEKRIDNAIVYMFGDPTGGTNHTRLESKVFVTADRLVDGEGNDAGKRVSDGVFAIYVEKTGNNFTSKNFVAIANILSDEEEENDTPADPLPAIRPGMSFSEFSRQISPALADMPMYGKDGFLMYGEGLATPEANKTVNVTVGLTRLISRIDVSVVTAARENDPYRFVLQSARLTAVCSSAWLVPQSVGVVSPSTAGLLEDTQWVTGITKSTSEEEPGITATPWDTYDNYWGNLYCYPTAYRDGSPAMLEIRGLYGPDGGQPAEFRIPLTSPYKDESNPGLNLAPNRRYVVIVDKVTMTDIQAQILVSEWNDETIDYTPVANAAPVAAPIEDANVWEWREDETVVWLPSLGESEIEFTVDGAIASDFFSFAPDWLTAERTAVESTADGIRETFLITIAANMEDDTRETRIEFRNRNYPLQSVAITIRQAGVPLALWAHQNLADYKVFVNNNQPLTEVSAIADASVGSWWQFGRNIAFPFTRNAADFAQQGIFLYSVDKIDVTDPIVQNRKAFLKLTDGNRWVTYTFPELPQNNAWVELANAVNIPGRPGDPCPEGWKMPDEETLASLIPSASGSIRGNVLFPGTDRAYAIRTTTARPVQTQPGYFEVKAIKVGTSVTEYTDPGLNWEQADIVRYFPLGSYMNSVEGNKNDSHFNHTRYWSSTTKSQNNPQHLNLTVPNEFRMDGWTLCNGYLIRCIRDNDN